MSLTGRNRWNRQPHHAARIDLKNPLGANVKHHQTGTDTSGWTAVNGHSRSVGAIGVDTSFAAASLQYLKATAQVTGYPFTFATVVKRRTTATNQAIISIGAATNDRHLLYFAANDTAAAFSGAGATIGQALSTATYVDTNKYYVIVGVFASATDRKVYVDGALQGSDTAAVSPAAADTAVIGAYWTSGAPVADFYLNADVPVSLISNKAWTDAQVADWSKHQSRYWQVFQPRDETIYVNVAAGGDVTVALTGSSSTTATGTLSPTTDKALSGASATGATGTLSPATDKALSGSSSTGSAGTITPNVVPALTGVSATGSQGSVSPSTTIALVGQSATGATGTVGVVGDVTVALTGVSATGYTGTLTVFVPAVVGGGIGHGGMSAKKKKYPNKKVWLVKVDQTDYEVDDLEEIKPIVAAILAKGKTPKVKAKPLVDTSRLAAEVYAEQYFLTQYVPMPVYDKRLNFVNILPYILAMHEMEDEEEILLLAA